MIIFQRNHFSRDDYVIFYKKYLLAILSEKYSEISMIEVIKIIIIFLSIGQIKRKYVIRLIRVFFKLCDFD